MVDGAHHVDVSHDEDDEEQADSSADFGGGPRRFHLITADTKRMYVGSCAAFNGARDDRTEAFVVGRARRLVRKGVGLAGASGSYIFIFAFFLRKRFFYFLSFFKKAFFLFFFKKKICPFLRKRFF